MFVVDTFARCASQRNAVQAVEALDKSLDMEIVAREQRQAHIEQEQWSSKNPLNDDCFCLEHG